MEHHNLNSNIVKGTIVLIDEEKKIVFVGVKGAKKEGEVSISEFSTIPKKNEVYDFFMTINDDGFPRLSKRKADEILFYDNLKKVYENKEILEGKVLSYKEESGVYEVSIFNGVFVGIVPKYLMSFNKNEDPAEYINTTQFFAIKKLQDNKKNKLSIILSRIAYLEQESNKNRAKFLETHKAGDIVEGVVNSFVPFGVFIDLGGFDGLLHISNMSWGHNIKPKTMFKKGDPIKVKFLGTSEDGEKIILSLKELQKNPWEGFLDRYKLHDLVEGRVIKIVDFGIFVEIEPGLEGLVHITDLSWSKKIVKPKSIYKLKDVVKARILGFDLDEKKISLSIKQATQSPWDKLIEEYTVGSVYTRKVVKVIASGIFVELEEGFDSFVHIEDFSWTETYKTASEVYKKGDEVTFIVLSSDLEEKKIKIGIKQAQKNPWKALKDSLKNRTKIDIEVKEIKDNSIILEYLGLEGIIPFQEIAETKEEANAKLESIKPQDRVSCYVLKINKTKKEFLASLRDVQNDKSLNIKEYITNKNDEKVKVFDILKDKNIKQEE